MHLEILDGEEIASNVTSGRVPAFMVSSLSGAGMWLISGFAALAQSPKLAMAYGCAAAIMTAIAYRNLPRETSRKRI